MSCGSSDTATKTFYVTLVQHNVIKGSSDFMEGNSSYIPSLPKLIAINIVFEYKIILVCHVILQDHVIIRSCGFKGRNQSR